MDLTNLSLTPSFYRVNTTPTQHKQHSSSLSQPSLTTHSPCYSRHHQRGTSFRRCTGYDAPGNQPKSHHPSSSEPQEWHRIIFGSDIIDRRSSVSALVWVMDLAQQIIRLPLCSTRILTFANQAVTVSVAHIFRHATREPLTIRALRSLCSAGLRS